MLLIAIAITLALLALSALLAAAETSSMLLTPGRVHRLVEAQVAGAESLETLFEIKHRLRAASALVAGLLFACAGYTGWQAGWSALLAIDGTVTTIGGAAATAVACIAGALVVIMLVHSLGQALPRTLAAGNPEAIGLQASKTALPFVKLLHPITKALGAPWKWMAGTFGAESLPSPWSAAPEWRVSEGGEETDRDEAEEALLEAVSDFAEKVAREIMVPRTDVTALPDTTTVAEAIRTIDETGYSRLPVYHQSIDDIRGVLYAKDVLLALGRESANSGTRVSRLARTPYFVPETKPVEELLLEMRTRTHIAVVADEYGGTAGIVTLEDLLEEIVGEISDEYDIEEPLLVELGEGRYRLDARLPVDDLNDIFDTDLDTDADSVGGLFIETSGRIPELGESIDIEGLRLTVTDRQETRIRQLTVEPAPRVEGETGA
ncbi:MAG TPA: hemolysin family protein [Coriobacteriia bacterium]|nr:hemolysin family protein [Coriobacteriia bacterium]